MTENPRAFQKILAYMALNANITQEKFYAICDAIPEIEPDAITEMIDADWNEPEHANWIKTASPAEVADWIAANK